MFGISGAEVMIILLVALIVLGPDRLPQVARKAGQIMGELKKVTSGFEAEMRTAMYEGERPTPHRPQPVPRDASDHSPDGGDHPGDTPLQRDADQVDLDGEPRPGRAPDELS